MWNIEYTEFFTSENIHEIVRKMYEKSGITQEINIQNFQYFFSEDINNLTNTNYNLVKLCRLFMGNLKMVYTNEDEDVQEYNLDSVFEKMFISENYSQSREEKVEEMVDFISEFTNINTEDDNTFTINNFLEKEFRSNVEFYNQILNEIEHFYSYQNKGFYTSAFVHLYRTYEYISYAFPLTYIQNTNNFYNSYEELKKFFGTNDKSSELNFFERFINQTFLFDEYISEDLYTENIEIFFPAFQYSNIKATLFVVTNKLNTKLNEVNKILREKGAAKIENVIEFNDDNSSLQISTLVFHGFIIELRNKAFHFKAARPDSLVAKYMYFEDLFKFINIHIYNWIAMIFKFVLKSAVNNRIS